MSIAWAVAEHLVANPRARPKTIFATHYHELTDLADLLPGVVNAHVTAREWNEDIVFLRKIAPGRSDRSYGIHVARLAGLPPSVVARARDILAGLEQDELSRGGRPTLAGAASDPAARQLGLFAQAPAGNAQEAGAAAAPDVRITERLRSLDVNGTTPRQALELLEELRKMAEEA
jgi:DNA mismatch repair protein MutS